MRRLFKFVLLYGALSSVAYVQDSMPSIDVRGLVDARLILTDNTVSWEERGLGKTRWGGDGSGDNRVVGRIAEASLVLSTKI